MSSLQTKNQSLIKGKLQRQSSFEKFKCTAFPLLGSIFTKEASFIHLLENSLNSSRAFVQKPALVLVIPAVHIFCVAMAVCVNLIRKLTGGVSFEKLDKFIAEIKQLKSKHQSYSVQKAVKAKINQTTKVQHDCGENEESEKLFSCCNIKTEKTTEKKAELSNKNRLMKITAFTSIFLVYIQFVFLLILISHTQIRAGFVFLLVCTFYLSYLVLEISFIQKKCEKIRVARRNTNAKRQTTSKSEESVSTEIQSQSQAMENYLKKEKLL